MERIVRLTEDDLMRLVKKVISEQEEKIIHSINDFPLSIKRMAQYAIVEWEDYTPERYGKGLIDSGGGAWPVELYRNESKNQFIVQNGTHVDNSRIIFDMNQNKIFYDKSWAFDPPPLPITPNMFNKFKEWFDKNNNYNPFSGLKEGNIDEGPLDSLGDLYRGVKGVKRGYGMDYFQNMSRLDRLIKKLKKLDQPNLSVMSELESLKSKVSSLNMPQQRKQAIISLIQNSIFHFNNYNRINDQILSQIQSLNLDSWK